MRAAHGEQVAVAVTPQHRGRKQPAGAGSSRCYFCRSSRGWGWGCTSVPVQRLGLSWGRAAQVLLTVPCGRGAGLAHPCPTGSRVPQGQLPQRSPRTSTPPLLSIKTSYRPPRPKGREAHSPCCRGGRGQQQSRTQDPEAQAAPSALSPGSQYLGHRLFCVTVPVY